MPTTSLRASYDTTAKLATPNTNYGEERFLAVRPSANDQQSFISFSGLPDLGAVISSATLRVWLKGANWAGGPYNLAARRIIEKWKESQLTWNNQPDVDNFAGSGATSNVTDGVDGQSVDIDVTSILAGIMTGDLYYGLRLVTTSGTVARQIYSSEAADPALRPLLLVEYSTLPDAPVDLSPSGGKRVSIAKPTFGWQFRDPDGDEQAAFQIQIEDNSTTQADGSFATPEYDSGWIPTSSEEFDSSLSGTGGALPTFVAAGAVDWGTGNITPRLPAGWAKNDILLLFAESDSADPAPAAPSGYAPVTGSSVQTPGTRLTVFWKRSTAAETAPTIVDVGNHLLARMIAVRGCRTTDNPWELTTTSVEAVSDTSGSASGPTTTQANCFIVIAATSDYGGAADTAGYSAWTNAALGSLTEQTDDRRTSGNGGTLAVATGTKATAGAVGATTYTLANAGVKAHLVIALAPTTSYGPTWAGISADADRWWIVRARDEQGQTSPWADVQAFHRTTKGTLAISSPTNGGTVEETTPPIITTLTGRAQEAISYTLEQFVTADNEWAEVWSQGRRAAPATSGSAYSFGVPAGKITAASTNYRLTVRSWDDQDRDATPGDPAYVQAQSTFTFVRSATPSAVTVLTAAQEANSGPGVLLTFNRAVGQAAPDYFALMVDSVRVMDRIDPASIIDGGSPIVFSFVYYGAEPYTSHTYEVEAVTLVSGVLKHSQGNDTEVFTPRPVGIWLQDDNDPPYKTAPRRVRLIGTASPSLGIGQSGATYHAVGRPDPVTIVDSISGFEGTVAGQINTSDPAEAGVSSIANFKWMIRPRNVGRRLRLIQTGLSVPVQLVVVDQFAPVGDVGAARAYNISFTVAQVAEFGEVD